MAISAAKVEVTLTPSDLVLEYRFECRRVLAFTAFGAIIFGTFTWASARHSGFGLVVIAASIPLVWVYGGNVFIANRRLRNMLSIAVVPGSAA